MIYAIAGAAVAYVVYRLWTTSPSLRAYEQFLDDMYHDEL